MIRTRTATLLICIVAALPGIAWGLEANTSRPESADAASLRQARTLLASGQAEEAYAVYAQLLNRHPAHNILLLGRARAAAASGRTAEAAADYAVLTGKFPDDPTLRREAASLALSAGNLAAAERLAEPPPVLDLRASRLSLYLPPRSAPVESRRAAAGAEPRTSFTGRVRAGVLYDSNANQGPASELFNLGNLTVFFPGAGRKGTAAAYAGANVNFLHRLSATGPWAMVADAGLFVRGNANPSLADTNSREWQWGRAAAGLRYAAGDNFFEARLKVEAFDYQFTNNIIAVGPELTYMRAVTRDFHLITQAWGDWRDYKRSHYLNGFYGQAGQFARLFFGERRHSLLFGAKYLGGAADRDASSYNGWEAMARFTYIATPKFEVSPHLSFAREYYRGAATALDRGKRRDDRLRAGLDLVYRINERWNLEANYQYVHNNSKSFLYKYDQHVVGVGMSRGF